MSMRLRWPPEPGDHIWRIVRDEMVDPVDVEMLTMTEHHRTLPHLYGLRRQDGSEVWLYWNQSDDCFGSKDDATKSLLEELAKRMKDVQERLDKLNGYAKAVLDQTKEV